MRKKIFRGCKLNFWRNKASQGYPQQKIRKSQEISGMGRMKNFLVKNKKLQGEGGRFHLPPALIRLSFLSLSKYKVKNSFLKSKIFLILLCFCSKYIVKEIDGYKFQREVRPESGSGWSQPLENRDRPDPDFGVSNARSDNCIFVI